jgi:hypothetical protein
MYGLPKKEKNFIGEGSQIFELPNEKQILVCTKNPFGYSASLRKQIMKSSATFPGFLSSDEYTIICEESFSSYKYMRNYVEGILKDFEEP